MLTTVYDRRWSSQMCRWGFISFRKSTTTIHSFTHAMSTARPEPKRIRSDKDHSKKDTKDGEEKRKRSDGDEGEQEENKDVDWLSEEPFRVGESWDEWKTVWRQSCWCGKSEPTILVVMAIC
jgi:hypothetical protein